MAATSKNSRSGWDEAMGNIVHPKPTKRTSGRQAVLSKAMRVVDEETRREVRDARLEALEADNYVESQGEPGDEAYVDSEDEESGGPSRKREAKKRKRAAAPGGKPGQQASRVIAGFKQKSLAQWVFEAGYDASNGPNYVTAAAQPSALPARPFCSVCGFWGRHACARCGMRYCCLKCQETHKETRCLKFATG